MAGLEVRGVGARLIARSLEDLERVKKAASDYEAEVRKDIVAALELALNGRVPEKWRVFAREGKVIVEWEDAGEGQPSDYPMQPPGGPPGDSGKIIRLAPRDGG